MLTAEEVTVTFGGVRAVDGVSLAVGPDQLVGLVGPNGSGKTTFLNALCGVVAAEGRLVVGGQEVPMGRPRAAWAAGLARVFQAPQTFEALSCIENVMLSSADRRGRGLGGAWLLRPEMLRRERARSERAIAALDFVGLASEANKPASQLTYGQRRVLELARAIAGEPSVLLLDEPSAGLNDAETASLGAKLRDLPGAGLAVVVVDHKVDFLDSICDRIVVLELGKVIAEGDPSSVWQDHKVMSAYLGAPDAEN